MCIGSKRRRWEVTQGNATCKHMRWVSTVLRMEGGWWLQCCGSSTYINLWFTFSLLLSAFSTPEDDAAGISPSSRATAATAEDGSSSSESSPSSSGLASSSSFTAAAAAWKVTSSALIISQFSLWESSFAISNYRKIIQEISQSFGMVILTFIVKISSPWYILRVRESNACYRSL